MERFHSMFRSVGIYRLFPSGMYAARCPSLLRADTLAGIKQLIRKALKR